MHVRDYTKGHPSIAANNHPVRHGPVVGIHNGIILNDDELLAPHSCARAEPRMTVDSEAIFALAAHSRNDPRALEALTRLDGRRVARRARARRRLRRARRRPAALGRPGTRRGLLRLHPRGARDRSSATSGSPCAHARCPRGRSSSSRAAALPAAPASGPISTTSRRARCRPCARPARRRPACGASRRSSRSLQSTRPSLPTRRPCSPSRSRTRYWNVDQAPRRASNMR